MDMYVLPVDIHDMIRDLQDENGRLRHELKHHKHQTVTKSEFCGVCKALDEVKALREAATRAAAELRHAWEGKTFEGPPANWCGFDRTLISRAIRVLERALAATEGKTE